ncbi:MAG: EAL domain-containing protein [Thermoanaerobaculia bacterium]
MGSGAGESARIEAPDGESPAIPCSGPSGRTDIPIDHFPDFVLAVTEGGHIVEANRAGSEAHGRRRDELIGHLVRLICHETSDRDRAFARAIFSGQTVPAEPEPRRRAGSRPSNLHPGRLAFAITESFAITDRNASRRRIRRLEGAGCVYPLDDFGVGSSSFAYFEALPVDDIEIDQGFVPDVATDATTRAVVDAVPSVDRSLGEGSSPRASRRRRPPHSCRRLASSTPRRSAGGARAPRSSSPPSRSRRRPTAPGPRPARIPGRRPFWRIG